MLDFGLAKALDDGNSGVTGDPALSPTLTSPATAMGMIIGTAAYMSPEQARGQAVDRRADIWAFGAVLYEMLAGTRAFPGETVSDTLAAVLKTDPAWTRLPAETPPAVRRLLARCLERDPRQRLQAIGEARIVLSSPNQLPDALRGTAYGGSFVAALVAAALALGGLAGAWWIHRRPSSQPAAAVKKLDLMLDGLETGINATPALSPDGERLVYHANGRLWLRALSEFVPKPVPGSSGAVYPFWSPDSRQIAFVREGKAWRASVDSTEATPVGAVPADLAGTGGGTWTAAGDLVLAGSDTVGLFAIPVNGGTGREILPLDRSQESDFHDVSELPDGRGLLFTVHRRAGADTIGLLADGTRRNLVQVVGESLRSPVYSPAGYLLYAREHTSPGVWGIRFSISRLATEGDPVLIVQDGATPSLGSDGTMAFVRPSTQPSQIVWIDRRGAIETVDDLAREVARAALFPTLGASLDRQRIAIPLKTPGGAELFVYDVVRRTMSRLSVGAGIVISPTWSADGRRVFFGSFAGSRASDVHVVPTHETRAPERVLPPSDNWRYPCSVSPDGRWLLYAEGVASRDLWVASLVGSGAPERLMHTPFQEEEAQFSPDGRWIAYTSDESGRPEIYVRAFPIGSDRIRVSTAGATMPMWSPSGQEIFYRTCFGDDVGDAHEDAVGIRAITTSTALSDFGSGVPELVRRRSRRSAILVHPLAWKRSRKRDAQLGGARWRSGPIAVAICGAHGRCSAWQLIFRRISWVKRHVRSTSTPRTPSISRPCS